MSRIGSHRWRSSLCVRSVVNAFADFPAQSLRSKTRTVIDTIGCYNRNSLSCDCTFFVWLSRFIKLLKIYLKLFVCPTLVHQCGKEFHQHLPRTTGHLFVTCCERRTNQTREEHHANSHAYRMPTSTWRSRQLIFQRPEDGFQVGSRNVGQANSFKYVFKSLINLDEQTKNV